MKSLKDKIAIITGGSQGIGLALLRLLLSKEVRVAVWSRSEPPLRDDRLFFFPTDVGDAEKVDKAWSQTKRWASAPIDYLVNNAGIGTYGPIEETTNHTWEQLFKTNMYGAFLCTRAVVPQMKEQQKGHIVQVGSVAGLRGTPYFSAYCATKFALRGFSESLMLELRESGIKVSYLAPGGTETSFFDQLKGFTPASHLMQADEVAQSILELLNSSPNYLPSCLEVRPLRPHSNTS